MDEPVVRIELLRFLGARDGQTARTNQVVLPEIQIVLAFVGLLQHVGASKDERRTDLGDLIARRNDAMKAKHRRAAILLGIDVGKEQCQTKEDHSPCFDAREWYLENVLVDEQFSETFGPHVESSIEIVGGERTR